MTRRSGPARRTRTASRWTSRRASGSRRASARTRRRSFCRQGSTHPSAQGVPDQSERTADADVRPEDQEGDDDRHLLRHAPSELRRQRRAVVHRRRRRSRDGSTRRSTTRPRTSRRHRAGRSSSLDTNGNGKRDAYVEPDQPLDPDQGQARQRAVLRRGAEPGRRLDLGIGARHAGDARAPHARIESAVDGADRGLRGAVEESEGVGTGLCAARHGRGQQRRRLDGALERASGQLRSAQVQGPAEWTERDRTALSGRLVALSAAGSELQGRRRLGQRRHGVLQLRRSLRHARHRQGRPARDRQRIRRRCWRSSTASS